MLKSQIGMPRIQFTGQRIDLAAEARKARRRLYPVTILYSTYAITVLALAFSRAGSVVVPLAYLLTGVATWTFIEYLAHRYVLHRRFPDGPSLVQHWTHLTFDNLHTEHHARPWDGNHINGTIRDTWLYMGFFAALSFLAPLHTAPAFWAAVMQSYVVEEWVHQSVHYVRLYGLGGPYWRYINRHHSYHHSPQGSELAFGLTNAFWDIVFATRVPERERRLMYGPRPARRPGRAAAA